MKRAVMAAVSLAAVAAGAGYLAGRHGPVLVPVSAPGVTAASGPIIYYRHPSAPRYALVPQMTEDQRPFVAVRASEDVGFEPAAAPRAGRILFYRNPMGLPDTSPVPKKDSMGMDYVPVYEDEDTGGPSIQVPVAKVQRAGVQSEAPERRILSQTLHVPGTVQIDERRQSVVALRFDAFITQVANVTTGDTVRKGQPLVRVYGPTLAADAAQYAAVVASRDAASGPAALRGARQRLENLDVPDSYIATIERTRAVPLHIDWPAPRDGVIVQRNAVDGMRSAAGEVLFRIADLSEVWVIADVSENDLPLLAPGQAASVRLRGYPERALPGRIALIYPQINKETRTARVRITLANPDGVLRPDMYAEVAITAEAGEPVLSVPDSAIIDTGTRQIVILDRGEGRFEPRPVAVGRRGNGFTEIRTGLEDGDWVVVRATFLIDAESNLRAALRGLGEAEAAR